MANWTRVASAEVPGGGGLMDLYRDGANFELHVDGRQLMASGIHGSEDALAERTAARLADVSSARVLIGGLGMGYTLAAALRAFGDEAEIVQAELVPEIVDWHHAHIGHIAGHPLRDPRVRVRTSDVSVLIREEAQTWDAILLDVDNGPEGLTHESNDRLYTPEGLDLAFEALRPGGVLAVWSGWADPAFTRRLSRAGFEVEEEEIRSRGDDGGRKHTIWFGRRPAGGAARGGWRGGRSDRSAGEPAG